jgi:hypothetical protein
MALDWNKCLGSFSAIHTNLTCKNEFIIANLIERSSELFNTKWAVFQLYNGENKLHIDEMGMMSALY